MFNYVTIQTIQIQANQLVKQSAKLDVFWLCIDSTCQRQVRDKAKLVDALLFHALRYYEMVKVLRTNYNSNTKL